jgi:hypothetical protein
VHTIMTHPALAHLSTQARAQIEAIWAGYEAAEARHALDGTPGNWHLYEAASSMWALSQPAPGDCPAWCNDHTYYVTAVRAFGVISAHRARHQEEGSTLEVSADSSGNVGVYVHDSDELSVDKARAFARTILAACDVAERSAPTL